MSTNRSHGNQNITIGGSVTGSLIGDNNRDVTITATVETSSASLDDLRKLIALLRDEIKTASDGESADTKEVQTELGKFEEELDADNPDGEMVGIRWKLVQKLLGPLEHVASIAQLADRIFTLTHTLFGGN